MKKYLINNKTGVQISVHLILLIITLIVIQLTYDYLVTIPLSYRLIRLVLLGGVMFGILCNSIISFIKLWVQAYIQYLESTSIRIISVEQFRKELSELGYIVAPQLKNGMLQLLPYRKDCVTVEKLLEYLKSVQVEGSGE